MTETTFYHNPTTKILGLDVDGYPKYLYLANVEFAWATNFKGEITQHDRNGHPKCNIVVSFDDAQVLADHGFKIYDYNPRKNNPELDPEQYPNKMVVELKLSMDSELIRSGKVPMPTVVSVIQGKEETSRVIYDADSVGLLDTYEKLDTTITVAFTYANPERGQKWTQPYIHQLGVVLADRVTYFEEQFGFFN